MKRILAFIAVTLSCALLAGPGQMVLLTVKTPAGGGGGAAWSESVASTDSTDTLDPDLSRGGPIVAGQSGTCTKLGFELVGWSSSVNVKIAALDASGVPLSSETVTIGSDPGNGLYQITLSTPFSVTSGTTYNVQVVSSTTQNILRYLASQPSGSGKYASTTYAGFPDNPTTLNNHPSAWRVSMYIVP